jgi:hypothetical protein
MDGSARGANDSMFSVQYYLPGSAFVPKYTGTGATATKSQADATKLNTDAQKYTDEATKYQSEADKLLTEAQTHDTDATKYQAEADKAKTPAEKTKYLAEVTKAQAAAKKARDDAAADQRKAQDAKAKADQAQQDAQTQAGDTGGGDTGGDTGGGDTSNASSTQITTFHDLMSKAGGDLADAVTETFGLDKLDSIISNSRLIKLGQAISTAKIGAPYLDKFFAIPNSDGTAKTDTTKSPALPQPKASPDTQPKASTDKKKQAEDISAQVYDDGGWLQPGDLAVNLGSRPEPILAPQQLDNLRQAAQGGMAGVGAGTPKAWVNIENIHHIGGDEAQTARRIVREMNTYQPRGPR